jgi:hypothetical protein
MRDPVMRMKTRQTMYVHALSATSMASRASAGKSWTAAGRPLVPCGDNPAFGGDPRLREGTIAS